MSTKITILGCGSSGGVPRVGFGWGDCDPMNKKNRRTRCSLLVERKVGSEKVSVLIDTGPDIRQQMLLADVQNLDAILYTHPHADHVHGIDDLRTLAYKKRKKIPVWADLPTQKRLHEGFGYIFSTPKNSKYPPICTLNLIENKKIKIACSQAQIEFLPLTVNHGDIDALGFKFENVVYMPDVLDIYPETWNQLQGLDLLIIDALRRNPHPSHTHLEKTLGWLQQLKPKKAILTNLHNDLDYDLLKKELPDEIEPAFDGLKFFIN